MVLEAGKKPTKLVDGLRSDRENWGQTGEGLEFYVERVRLNQKVLGSNGEKQNPDR